MVRLFYAALVCLALAMLISYCTATRGDEQSDCMAWADLVVSLESMPPHERRAQQAGWLYAAREQDPLTAAYLGSALNWLALGMTGEQAWRECGGI